MSTTTRRAPERQYSEGAVAVTAMAGTLMVLIGAMHIVQGLVALVNDEFFVLGEEYVFKFDVTTWGWVHLVAGAIILLAGVALFQGATWARVVAVAVAGVSILFNFAWMPYYPLWSLTIIAFDAFVIWAVTAHGRDIAA